MTDTIWKYLLEIVGMTTLSMPKGAGILAVQVQAGQPCLWAVVNQDETQREDRTFTFVGTGRSIPDTIMYRYVGTIQQEPCVWHLCEILPMEAVP